MANAGDASTSQGSKVSTDDSNQSEQIRHAVPAASLRSFTHSLLVANGLSDAHAHTITHALVLADLRGVDTHGTSRLPPYLRRLRAGLMSPRAEPTVTHPAAAVALVDARNAFGHIGGAVAVDSAAELADKYGVGVAGVRNGNHFGMSAWLVERAVERGMAVLVFTNSSPAMPPWGGRDKLLGVSPLAAGVPGRRGCSGGVVGQGGPWILDMAPSVAARGKVHKALRRGEQIPEGWALDREGKGTRDPAAALEGVMLPSGGPKGSALSVMMDMFGGVLTGAAFAGAVAGPFDASSEAGVGHFVVCVKADLFVSREGLEQRMQESYEKVVRSGKAAGVERIWFPGEVEQEERAKREAQGIPMTEGEMEALNEEARLGGCGELKVS